MNRASILLCCALAMASVKSFAEDGAPLRLTVADAVARAEAASARLAQLGALERAATAGRDAARAARNPQIDLRAGYQRQSHAPELTVLLPGAGVQTIFPDIPDNYFSRAAVSVPLYAGGRLSRTIEAAEGEARAAQRDRDAGGADLTLEATAAYWSLATARENERVLTEAIVSYEAHLVDARNRQKVGLAAVNEVLAVAVRRDEAELARLSSANSARAAEANLARLLDLPGGIRIEPVDELLPTAEPPPPLDGLVAEALKRRPECAALRERMAAAAARAAAFNAGAAPQVSLNAGYDYSSPNRRILPPTEQWRSTWDASVVASWAVFDAGRTKTAVAQARAQAEAARFGLSDLERHIRFEVTERRLDVDTARAAVRVADRGLESATENHRVSKERYRAGVLASSDLLDAEVDLLRAGLLRTNALAALRVAEAGLARAVGK